jgi:hypothetical protein
MDKKTLRYCAIASLATFLGSVALPRLWGFAVGGLFLPTGSWLVIIVIACLLSFICGSLLWLSIPSKIRTVLDNFTLQMGIRIESMQGGLASDLNKLRILFEQHLENKDQESIASQEMLMAEFVPVFLTRAIADSHLAAGQCKVCGGKHPKASELPPGDPALYSYEAHGKLEDGKPCPIPFLYKLAKERHNTQSRRISK